MRVYRHAAPSTPAERAFLSRLRATGVASGLIRVEACPSTNDLAREAAEADVSDGVLVLARTQTQGRGRRSARWSDEPGACLLASLAWKPPSMGAPELPFVSLAAAAAAAEAARSVGVDARVKWPNDVWVRDRKLAGVLVESTTRRMQARLVTIGVGMNVHAAPDISRDGRDDRAFAPATCVDECGGDPNVTIEGLAIRFCASLGRLLDAHRTPVRTRVIEAVRELDALKGRGGLVSLEGEEWAVRSFDIADDGSLIAHLNNGGYRVVRDSRASVRPI